MNAPQSTPPAVRRMAAEVRSTEIQQELDQLLWYHTIDVVPGATTRGWFDQRHAVPLMPFPDLHGARCLDIGTWDGFYAYEMERRGAAEVVAVDIPDLAVLDYPPEVLAEANFEPNPPGRQERPAGFHLLHRLLNSKVQRYEASIYDLEPASIGMFDFVVVGSLLLHLRDPVRALDAVRRVTKGQFLSIDYIHPPVQLLGRRRPLFQLSGESADFQWWLPNDAGQRHLLHVGGFQVEKTSKYFLIRQGTADGARLRPAFSGRNQARAMLERVLTGDRSPGGVLHRAYLTRPRF